MSVAAVIAICVLIGLAFEVKEVRQFRVRRATGAGQY